jgi:hypothetical protein
MIRQLIGEPIDQCAEFALVRGDKTRAGNLLVKARVLGWTRDPSITSSRPQRFKVCSFLPGHAGPGLREWRTICLNVVGDNSTISAKASAAPYPPAQSWTGRHNRSLTVMKFPAGRVLARSIRTGLLACGNHGPMRCSAY